MPKRVFSFDQPDRFICGAVGQPGQRTFFLQASQGERVVSVALEKVQVAVLAERVAMLLAALRDGGLKLTDRTIAPPPALTEPVVEEFRVGALSLGWDGERQRVIIEASDASDEGTDEYDDDSEDDSDEDEEQLVADLPPADVLEGHDVVRVQLEPDAALAFASGAVAVVQAGRPPCPNCGAPLESTGHFCVRRNGYAN
jgi:uncharacterized repeat protein (TIGR03847 family)